MNPRFVVGAFLILFSSTPLFAEVDVGDAAPNFTFSKSWNLAPGFPDINSLRGRPVLVEHWATWCPPCVDNVPHMNELHDSYSARGLTIIAVSDESPAVIERFINRHNLRYPVVQSRLAGGLYGVAGIPHAFLLNAAGAVTWTDHPANLTGAMIEPLLGASAASAAAPITMPASSAAPGFLWLGVVVLLAVFAVGALGWFWWSTRDRVSRPAPVNFTPYAQAPPQPPGPHGQPPQYPPPPTSLVPPPMPPAGPPAPYSPHPPRPQA